MISADDAPVTDAHHEKAIDSGDTMNRRKKKKRENISNVYSFERCTARSDAHTGLPIGRSSTSDRYN